ncbi:MAG: hypothetical protein IPK79_00185 [Vampirovibrionales bacterium]|nr:hypothetical protein [Vampirovibrionales bacterium]
MRQTYYITAPPNAKPWGLKDALAEYKLDIKYAAELYYTNGATRRVRDFERFKAPAENLLLLASWSVVIAGGFLLPPVTFVGAVATGSGLGMAAGAAGVAAGVAVAPKGQPALMLIEVTFRNVTEDRIKWAEYALVTWCLLNRYELRGDLVEGRNLTWAQNRLNRQVAEGQKPSMPTPWGSTAGKRKASAKRAAKANAPTAGAAKQFGKWLWGK